MADPQFTLSSTPSQITDRGWVTAPHPLWCRAALNRWARSGSRWARGRAAGLWWGHRQTPDIEHSRRDPSREIPVDLVRVKMLSYWDGEVKSPAMEEEMTGAAWSMPPPPCVCFWGGNRANADIHLIPDTCSLLQFSWPWFDTVPSLTFRAVTEGRNYSSCGSDVAGELERGLSPRMSTCSQINLQIKMI